MKSLLIVICIFISSSNIDYSTVWPEDFQYAVEFINEQTAIIDEVFQNDSDVATICLSVGFPEVIRYNAIRDFFETKTLELAYVAHGLDAVDFSIGHFQMKASFAEAVEQSVGDGSEFDTANKLLAYKCEDDFEIRKERINRLQDLKWQFIYLKVFVQVMFQKYPELHNNDKEYQIAFLASAYNYGFQSSHSQIRKWISVKAFPHGLKAGANQYSYADISKFYYRNYANKLEHQPSLIK